MTEQSEKKKPEKKKLEKKKASKKNKDSGKDPQKEAQLVIRIDDNMRSQFVKACKNLDTSASREVRRFIKKFLRDYEKGELDDA